MGQDIAIFVLAVLGLLATPGPTNTLLATSGAISGVRRSLPLLAAELGGYLLAIMSYRLVLGPVIDAFPLIGRALKVAVAGYLVLMAIQLWRSEGQSTGPSSPVRASAVFTTTLLNPKALIFAFAIFPAEEPQPWAFILAFVACVPAVGAGWVVAGRLVGASIGRGRANAVRRVASMVLLGFAAFLMATAFG